MNKRKCNETDSMKTARLSEACARYGLGENTMRKIAKECGANIKIGKCYLINLSVVDAYMDSLDILPSINCRRKFDPPAQAHCVSLVWAVCPSEYQSV